MILNIEMLRQKARELALQHDPRPARRLSKHVWRKFHADVESLRTFVRSLQDSRTNCSQPAEEWLLDNAEFIEEQVFVVREQLWQNSVRRLPHIPKERTLRILSLCADYLKHVDCVLDEETLVAYTNAYQDVSVLTIAEVWSIPFILRIALLSRLADMMKSVRERREVCAQVERFLTRIKPANINADTLNAALDEAGLEMPLSGAWIAHLVSHLREWADDTSTLSEWLMCKLENGQESLEQIVSYEHQLQAAHQVTAENLFQSLRKVERLDWRDPFEQICLVERTLCEESTGIYAQLDFSSRDTLRKRVETLARRMRVPENLVAKQAIELAAQFHQKADAKRERDRRDVEQNPASEAGKTDSGTLLSEALPRQAFVAYYLLEPAGIRRLRLALKSCAKPRLLPGVGLWQRATGGYFGMQAGLFALFVVAFAAWVSAGARYSAAEWAATVIALALPASEWSVSTAHWLIERFIPPRPLLRYDFSRGIPEEATTMVVIPVIWSTPEEVREMAHRLELHYLANRDPHLHFALLGDFADAATETVPEDAAVLEAARESIEALNKAYSRPGGPTFHLFQRRRLWNPSEGVWMGWERKRGKLVEFVELLRGRQDTSYNFVVGDETVLRRIRYVITLDADTQLPMGSAQRMIGTMHLPYNRPRLNKTKTRVVEGYGVLQPRIGISHEAALATRLSYLWCGESGIDPYVFAVSDPYQDGLGQGIFTGKGIFDVETFAQVLCDRIPENRVLSHDLLEGGFLRAGLLSDIELVDGHPSTFSAYQQRLHRWVRGDWQLLCWLLPRFRNRRGALVPVDLSALTRWQIVDNLRRSLLLPALFAAFALGLTVLPGVPSRWVAIASITLGLPVIRQLAGIRKGTVFPPKGLMATIGQVAVAFWTLPFQSVLMFDAIGKTLYRLLVSKRHLLEWVSSAEVERRNRGGRRPLVLGVRGGYALLIVFAFLTAITGDAMRITAGFTLTVLWALAPLGIRWLERPMTRPAESFMPEEETELRKLAQHIWAYFEDYANQENNWLPPDNVQVDPPKGVAHRTSPTNIGLYLACALSARDFGFIDTPGLIGRLERTVGTIERMEKWNGHLYNWYDTVTLEPLSPIYVSTVDSGNFVACLIAVKEGLAEWLRDDPPAADWRERGVRLIDRLERLIVETDFRPLYDHKSKLFTLGYHVTLGRREDILYDLLASESRQASFVAIALGQVSVAHWFALGRTMTKIGKEAVLVSWSGTMFEYLMPWNLMRTYPNTLWDSTYRGVVRKQIEYARRRGVPFGISESGYYAFDYEMNYQYQAFGVPGLGFKRGLERDLVIAPYATILAMPFAKRESLDDLRKLESLGARGTYGFYEAVDCTQDRLPEGQSRMIVRSFMAHHQGMSMLTLANLLLPKKMYDRFHRDKRVQAAELLLQERIPARPVVMKRLSVAHAQPPEPRPAVSAAFREFVSPHTPAPEVCVLSNGSYTTVVTASGGGFSKYKGVAVSRWREDFAKDDWGSYIYIRDVAQDTVWSPTFQPCRVPTDEYRVQFSLDRATFRRADGDFKTSLDICVDPESDTEVRRLTISYTGNEERVVEITTFQEIALATQNVDESHPTFSKLFVETEYCGDAECLLARRRPRDKNDTPLWAVHTLTVSGREGAVEYETDRARFVGRGRTLEQPQAIRARLNGTVGAVADPVFVMRRRFTISPGEQLTLYAITGVAETKEEAIGIASRLCQDFQVDRAFRIARTRSQIELRHLNLPASEAMSFHTLAGRILYASPLKDVQANSAAANTKGQSGLWAYGISGDLPIVLVRVADKSELRFVGKLLTGYDFLRRKGLDVDLVVLNESADGYEQHVQDAVRRATDQGIGRHGYGRGDVFVLSANRMSEDDRTLLFAVSRVMLRAGGASLRAQLRIPRRNDASPEPFVTAAPPDRHHATVEEEEPDLTFFNGYGGFTPDGREYRIVLKNGDHLPAPWINVIANPHFGCIVSELYTGYTWWLNSRECKLTPWSNDPVLDPPGELCYLRDEESGEYWTVAPSRGEVSADPCIISHGHGYSRFRRQRHGLLQEMTVFVPLDAPVKVIELRIANKTRERRKLSVTYYADWVLGVRRKSGSLIVTEWDEESRSLLARNAYQETFRDATAFLTVCPQAGPLAEVPESLCRTTRAAGNDAADDATATNDTSAAVSPAADVTWTADRLEFIGRNGTAEKPEAMRRSKLSGKTGPIHDACGAVQAKLTVEPGEERTVIVLLGCERSRESAIRLARRFSDHAVCKQAFADVCEFWDGVLGQITVSTPSPETNVLLNRWLLYQTLACRMWARTAFYQAGGAFGFRDQLQDALAMLHSKPDITRAQIVFHAAHQYEEGDVQHWWHMEMARGIRSRYTDDLLWLPYAVARYVEHTGDDSLLDETVPFLRSEPLQDEEHERYEPTVSSEKSGTVYEHCVRAIERSLRFGEHGIPLIGGGDWNDGLNRVGDAGRGESVWLGWFLGDVLRRFAEVCERRGDVERASRYRTVRNNLAASLDEHAWDGQWYRRAFTDDGQWLGSVRSTECRIDAIAQSWSVISGMADKDKAAQAMRSFDRELVDRDLNVSPLLAPPFDRTEPSPGYIQGYPPGIRENGGQYTHGAIWSVIAWCQMGEGDKAFELFNMINPVTHTHTPSEARRYAGEPYVMAADVYSVGPRKGHAGWTWYTGSAGWMYQAGIEWILGLRRRGQRLYIRPCIPREWPGFSVIYRYGSAQYRITVQNAASGAGGKPGLVIDGREAAYATDTENGPYVELRDDGRDHHVVLTL